MPYRMLESEHYAAVVLTQRVRDSDFYGMSGSDTLATVILTQLVRNFDFLLTNVGVWPFRHLAQHSSYPSMAFRQTWGWYRSCIQNICQQSWYVDDMELIWGSCFEYKFRVGSLSARLLVQLVRNFDFLQNTYRSRHRYSGSCCTWFWLHNVHIPNCFCIVFICEILWVVTKNKCYRIYFLRIR